MEQKSPQRAGGVSTAVPVNPGASHGNGYPHLSCGAAAWSHHDWQEIRAGLKLSARELQIVQGIFDDKLEYAIAAELGISINTVRTELRRLRRKLKITNRVSLVLRVVEEFLRQTASARATLPATSPERSTANLPQPGKAGRRR